MELLGHHHYTAATEAWQVSDACGEGRTRQLPQYPYYRLYPLRVPIHQIVADAGDHNLP
jgi:hypothetical protein